MAHLGVDLTRVLLVDAESVAQAETAHRSGAAGPRRLRPAMPGCGTVATSQPGSPALSTTPDGDRGHHGPVRSRAMLGQHTGVLLSCRSCDAILASVHLHPEENPCAG